MDSDSNQPRPTNGRRIVITRSDVGYHSGVKAPTDVRKICRDAGFETIDLAPFGPTIRDKLVGAISGNLSLMRRAPGLRPTDRVVVQYPVGKALNGALRRICARSKTVCLVHDINSFRSPTRDFGDMQTLNLFSVVIAQNEVMAKLLEAALSEPQVISLGLFDYLTSMQGQVGEHARKPNCLYFIGSLSRNKSRFLYTLKDVGVTVIAYGPHADRLPSEVVWGGVIDMNKPELNLIDGFGLVWDGESSETLEGGFGEYLKYNTPHKLSFYLTLGLPVIVPAASAMARFVEAENIGFTVNSVHDAGSKIASCSEEEWRGYTAAALRVRENLLRGHYTRTALARAMSAIDALPS